jgi:hypothetical protein
MKTLYWIVLFLQQFSFVRFFFLFFSDGEVFQWGGKTYFGRKWNGTYSFLVSFPDKDMTLCVRRTEYGWEVRYIELQDDTSWHPAPNLSIVRSWTKRLATIWRASIYNDVTTPTVMRYHFNLFM